MEAEEGIQTIRKINTTSTDRRRGTHRRERGHGERTHRSKGMHEGQEEGLCVKIQWHIVVERRNGSRLGLEASRTRSVYT